MGTQEKAKDILKNILEQYGVGDKVLFQLSHKFMIHVDLSPDYQYLEDWSLNEIYVEDCIKKSVDVFKFMDFSNNLLVVYEDAYGEHGVAEKDFLESTLIDIQQNDTYKLKWNFPEEATIYNCNRHIYHVKELNIQELFREIILSNIGGELDFCSSISIIDIDSGSIFRLYDDRGLYLFATKEEYLTRVWKQFYNDIFVDCKNFKIEVNNLYWIDDNKDDPNDLCLHGDIIVTIGEEELSYQQCTASAAALRMLKTLSENYLPTEGGQMLPCCGHFVIPNETLDEVDIVGCDNGIDWTVMHDNGMIKLITEKGNTVFVYYLQYKEEVLKFADIVKDYYKKSLPKNMPEDEFERNGYIAFWNEWNRRK